jgi:hypothetical protein
MTEKDASSSDAQGESAPSRPLDKLLSKRSKPFRDWKEEREYLRRKWGPQGKRIELDQLNEGDTSDKDA